MPRSKRDKKVSLTKTVKKGLTFRQRIADDVKKCSEEYACIFIFTVQNMRNEKLKELRKEWRHSRFFFGKNKIMAHGLGRNAEEEVQKNIHKLAKEVKGQCGLLFTNRPKDEVVEWFTNYHEEDFARTGDIATDTVTLDAGPLSQFQHSMEPHLRQQGLPTTLDRGVITLVKDYKVCKKGDVLTPEQARTLKLLEIYMATFRLHLRCVWTNDGTFEYLNKENSRRKSEAQSSDPEEMEMEDRPSSEDEDDEECDN